ncbi:hypothetical protein PR202_gb05689 [Eleusine coracana subsp. coracana]|uniref:Cell wall hydroxyproline-rich glycoprotein n=1 Tax=Eleusine coracana subsp. coracana TaxID=191504 RepID=A0AAV5E602_ELECO|nr:hypothetical protein PR202_gb05689 [Eleusine coracana subsp. coracana]
MTAHSTLLPFLFLALLLSPQLLASAAFVSRGLSADDEAHIRRRQLLQYGNGGGSSNEVDPSYTFPNPRLRDAYIALQAWKRAILSDPYNVTGSWWGPDVCSYHGVFCAPSPSDPYLTVVASIDLNHADLAGHLPDELGLLGPDLAVLHLNSNRFCGLVPRSLAHLHLLHELDLSNNRLVGGFPHAVLEMPALRYLDLRYNEFEGPVPSELFDRQLDAIFLNSNRGRPSSASSSRAITPSTATLSDARSSCYPRRSPPPPSPPPPSPSPPPLAATTISSATFAISSTAIASATVSSTTFAVSPATFTSPTVSSTSVPITSSSFSTTTFPTSAILHPHHRRLRSTITRRRHLTTRCHQRTGTSRRRLRPTRSHRRHHPTRSHLRTRYLSPPPPAYQESPPPPSYEVSPEDRYLSPPPPPRTLYKLPVWNYASPPPPATLQEP